ncbi:MAG: hypothetical protein JSW55_11490, partial [Chloroflexota bacterium]
MRDIIVSQDTPDIFCSDLSRESGEPMFGTAPTVDAWFLLEYDRPWTAKATDDNDLPRSAQEWLAEGLVLTESGRIQFVKQSRPDPEPGITFFVAQTREIAPLLYEFHLDTYDDLNSLDLPALLTGAAKYDQHIRREPLYLVCTNGRRDRCCSRYGLALYQSLSEQVGDAAWQCTHLGGHRYAPTLVTFPDGAYYGRLTSSDVATLVLAQSQDELLLPHLRGRCCFDIVVQVAEAYLRQKTGLLARDAYRLLGAQPVDENLWTIRFGESAGGDVHQLALTVRLSDDDRLVSCSPP